MGDTTWERVLRWALVAVPCRGGSRPRHPIVPGLSAMLELRGIAYRYAGYAKPVLHDIDLTLADGDMSGVVGGNEVGQVDAVPRRLGSRAGIDRRRDHRRRRCRDRWHVDGRQAAARVRDAGRDRRSRTRRRSCPGVTGIRLRGGRARADEPRPAGARDGRADQGRRSRSSTSRPWPSANRAACPAARRSSWSSPRCWRCDRPISSSTNRPPSSTRKARDSSATALRELAATGTALLIVEHKTDLLDGLCDRVAGRSTRDGSPSTARPRGPRRPAARRLGRRGAVADPAGAGADRARPRSWRLLAGEGLVA